jgi:hypothetical protein
MRKRRGNEMMNMDTIYPILAMWMYFAFRMPLEDPSGSSNSVRLVQVNREGWS